MRWSWRTPPSTSPTSRLVAVAWQRPWPAGPRYCEYPYRRRRSRGPGVDGRCRCRGRTRDLSTWTSSATVRSALYDLTFPLCRDLIDEFITVSNQQVSSAIRRFWSCRSIVEPAGALGLAGLLSQSERLDGKRVLAVTCVPTWTSQLAVIVSEPASKAISAVTCVSAFLKNLERCSS